MFVSFAITILLSGNKEEVDKFSKELSLATYRDIDEIYSGNALSYRQGKQVASSFETQSTQRVILLENFDRFIY